MNRIGKRLRKVRVKLARTSRSIEIADRVVTRSWNRARHARDVAEKARRQGRIADARRANARANIRKAKAERWLRRKHWLQGRKRYLKDAEKQWVENKQKWLKDHPPPASGWSTWTGRDVPNWMVPWLKKSVEAGWDGSVVSGIRTPAYSISLCQNMCGANSCSGRCAGAGSNHNCTSGCPYPTGAIDVTDYYNFERIQYKIGSPLRNNLPIDRVHFSISGY